jgi:6-phosphofructokinase 1
MLSTLQGVEAVKAVLDATPETPTPFIAINENQIRRKPLMEAVIETKEVSKAIEEKDFDRAMSLRDAEFADIYKSYLITTSSDLEPSRIRPENKVSLAYYYQ